MSVLIPSLIREIIEGYLQDYVYEQYYYKNRCLAGVMDVFYFFMAILEGILAGIG